MTFCATKSPGIAHSVRGFLSTTAKKLRMQRKSDI